MFNEVARNAYDVAAFRNTVPRWIKLKHRFAALALQYGLEKCEIYTPAQEGT